MNNQNKLTIEGNLTRDPQLIETAKGTKVCTFSLASNRYYLHNDESMQEVSFFDVETWAELAAQCSQLLKKGRGVKVEGRLKQDRWKDLEGRNHSKIKIVASNIDFKPEFASKKENREPAMAFAESAAVF
jgi:single-strand DNA-binding protein